MNIAIFEAIQRGEIGRVKKPKTLDKVFSVRVDEKKIDRANQLQLDIQQIFRNALDRALLKADGKCHICGTARIAK